MRTGSPRSPVRARCPRSLVTEAQRNSAIILYMLQDIRYAFRMLKKNPILSVVAILTIALGIGANTAIFSIVNSVLIQPLPYRETDRLFTIHEFAPNGEDQSIWIMRDRYRAWKKESKSF